ncbi:phasin family protein [Acidovorax sp. A1169]|uniref:phasin family protein n=1 Tax=Acidovorax sp. A1169 TaxID=3059524 RepID=UPI002737A501|nr:phasin family protein [Acidovorax sp. A1169]MDP4076760.1 phasin family protein [Acidovorax sp. A1169]
MTVHSLPLPSAPSSATPLRGFWDAVQQHQSAAIADCVTSLCRGLDGMRKAQAHTVQAVAQRHAAIAEKPKGPCTPCDLVALQTEWLQFGMESAVRYWQQMGMLALDMQTSVLGFRNQYAYPDFLLEAASALDRATGRGIASTHS